MHSISLASLLGLGLYATTAKAGVDYVGVAISGIDWNCDIDGTCPYENVQVPLASLGGADSVAQMKHFVEDNGINVFRIPVSWQFLLNGTTIGTLNSVHLQNYYDLMQACLDTGVYCMIDLHNFARFENGIIGQGGPTNDEFADLWTQLATYYADESKVIFGIMNEPHDLDVDTWVETVQAAVTAIREAGATTQTILLPGSNFQSAATISTTGGGDGLLEITNPDGTKDNLILDIHKYLDNNNSGSVASCATDNVGNFTIVAEWLRKKERVGYISETGASDEAECLEYFRAQNEYINNNSDVFMGLVGWAAGGFSTDYILSLTPTELSNGTWVNTEVMEECILAPWGNTVTSSASSSSSSSSSTSSSSTSKSTKTSSSSSSSKTATTTTATTAATATATSLADTTSSSSSSSAAATTTASSSASAWGTPISRVLHGLLVVGAMTLLL